MAFFIATGTISNDIVRRETRNGVVTTFRLETGAPRGGKLWIDVECWGHLAGTIAHHGATGRHVSVSGRLTQKTWRDATTGDARVKCVITASDIDLHAEFASAEVGSLLNSVQMTGVVESVLPTRRVRAGSIIGLRVVSGRSSSKTGRLCFTVEQFIGRQGSHHPPDTRDRISVAGPLSFRSARNACDRSCIVLEARNLVLDH